MSNPFTGEGVKHWLRSWISIVSITWCLWQHGIIGLRSQSGNKESIVLVHGKMKHICLSSVQQLRKCSIFPQNGTTCMIFTFMCYRTSHKMPSYILPNSSSVILFSAAVPSKWTLLNHNKSIKRLFGVTAEGSHGRKFIHSEALYFSWFYLTWMGSVLASVQPFDCCQLATLSRWWRTHWTPVTVYEDGWY